MINFGREICGDLGAAEGREWLVTNGLGSYASGTVAYMTYLLLNNEDRSARIEGINLFVDYEDRRRLARVDHIRLERSTARPGETLNMEVELQPYRAEPITVEIPLKIPEEAAEGKALLQGGRLADAESHGSGGREPLLRAPQPRASGVAPQSPARQQQGLRDADPPRHRGLYRRPAFTQKFCAAA